MDELSKNFETMEEAFFKPIDNLWGLHGIRAKLANERGGYEKTSLFLPVSIDEKTPTVDLSESIDLLKDDSLGLAFTINKVIEEVRVELDDEVLGKLVTGFHILVTLVTKDNFHELQDKLMTAHQVSPILFLPKDVILEAEEKRKIAEKKRNEENGLVKGKEKEFTVLRVGQYRDGRYVLFLHGSQNESHNPIRIPPEQ